MWNSIIGLYENYIGTGMIAGLLLVAMIYLLVTEKNKATRIVFLYMPLMVLILFFCPFFASLFNHFVGIEIYFRFMWLVPVAIIVGYAAVKVIASLSGKERLIAALAMAAIVMTSGSFIYKNTEYPPAENIYHVPQEVVDICDAIKVEGREVMAAFPREHLLYVRQYSPYVCMPYGREEYTGQMQNDLYDVLMREKLDAEEVVYYARQKGCHFVIISEEKQVVGKFEDYDYRLFDKIGGYLIYEDLTIYKGL